MKLDKFKIECLKSINEKDKFKVFLKDIKKNNYSKSNSKKHIIFLCDEIEKPKISDIHKFRLLKLSYEFLDTDSDFDDMKKVIELGISLLYSKDGKLAYNSTHLVKDIIGLVGMIAIPILGYKNLSKEKYKIVEKFISFYVSIFLNLIHLFADEEDEKIRNNLSRVIEIFYYMNFESLIFQTEYKNIYLDFEKFLPRKMRWWAFADEDKK